MQTTEMYTRADPSVKLEALEAMIAPKLRSGRFKATEQTDRLAHIPLRNAEHHIIELTLQRGLVMRGSA